jgi:hypothetical protein
MVHFQVFELPHTPRLSFGLRARSLRLLSLDVVVHVFVLLLFSQTIIAVTVAGVGGETTSDSDSSHPEPSSSPELEVISHRHTIGLPAGVVFPHDALPNTYSSTSDVVRVEYLVIHVVQKPARLSTTLDVSKLRIVRDITSGYSSEQNDLADSDVYPEDLESTASGMVELSCTKMNYHGSDRQDGISSSSDTVQTTVTTLDEAESRSVLPSTLFSMQEQHSNTVASVLTALQYVFIIVNCIGC